jgi:hypothetical protein
MTATETDPAALAVRMRKDLNFTVNAIAAVLANEETAAVFRSVVEGGGEGGTRVGLQITSPTTFSYNIGPASEKLAMSVSSGPGDPNAPANQLILIGYYQGQWLGLLPEARGYLQKLPMGILVTALMQALFGTRLGPVLLIALLAL